MYIGIRLAKQAAEATIFAPWSSNPAHAMMILGGPGDRLQICWGLTAQRFDSSFVATYLLPKRGPPGAPSALFPSAACPLRSWHTPPPPCSSEPVMCHFKIRTFRPSGAGHRRRRARCDMHSTTGGSREALSLLLSGEGGRRRPPSNVYSRALLSPLLSSSAPARLSMSLLLTLSRAHESILSNST
mgnify:FL=1